MKKSKEKINTNESATQKLQQVQNETEFDILKKLNEYQRCLLVRPTGFGKTKIGIDIAKQYKHIVFMYPNNHIKEAIKRYDIKGLDMLLYNYASVRNMYKKDYDSFKRLFSRYNSNDSIIILDEAHFIGAKLLSKAILALMEDICPNANFLGMTATPNRTDRLDIKWHFFNGYTVYEYELHNAIQDKIFKKPYYIYTPLNGTDVEKRLRNKISNLDISLAKKAQLWSRIKEGVQPEKLNIQNLDDIIYRNLDLFKNDMNYYKFILFFTTHQNLHAKLPEILKAFRTVFPNCKINYVIITSEGQNYKANQKLVYNLHKQRDTIDLILNVNMLTCGYHVPDTTGVMMFRRTTSDIIYAQQVGRCLSVMQKESTIIFDFVDNLNASYNYITEYDTNGTEKRKALNSLGILFADDDIILDDRTKEFLEIERLTDNIIREKFEEEVVNAYKTGMVRMDYVLCKLQLHDEYDFMKVLERYK